MSSAEYKRQAVEAATCREEGKMSLLRAKNKNTWWRKQRDSGFVSDATLV